MFSWLFSLKLVVFHPLFCVSDQNQEQSFLIILSMTHFLLWNHHILMQKCELCNTRADLDQRSFNLQCRQTTFSHDPCDFWEKKLNSLCMSCHTSCVGGSSSLGRRRRDLSVGFLLYHHELVSRIFSVGSEMVKSLKRHHCDLITGLIWMLQLLAWFLLFSLSGAEEPEEQLSWREMLWIYAMLPLLLSQAWGRETGLNINIISEPYHLYPN